MRKVTVGAVITVEDPDDNLIRWAKRELTLINPQWQSRNRMGLWTQNVPQFIRLYELNGNKLILPFGTLKYIQGATLAYDWKNTFKPVHHIDYGGAKMKLYPYQQKAVEEAYKAYFGIIQAPAGSGKTQMGIALAKIFGRRTLWLTHTADLLAQSKERAMMYMDQSLIGTITAGRVRIGEGITFATVQTMANLDLDRYKDEWDLVICDECHRVSGSPTTVTRYQRVLSHLSARHKYGLSATVHRSDGMIRATYALLGDICTKVLESDVGDRVVPVTVRAVGTPMQLSRDCLSPDGTLVWSKAINALAENETRNAQIVEDLIANRDHYCIILSDRLTHLHTLMDMLPDDLRDQAVMVDGKMTSKKARQQRADAIDQMRSGEKRYLFATYALAKEGLDIPRLDRLFMTTPQKDYAVVTQSLGRIGRAFDGKGTPIAYDYVDGNIPHFKNAYKKRITTYNKLHCLFDV